VAVSERIFPALESPCIVSLLPLKFDSILLPGLSGRRKRCVNHAKLEETRECQGCLGRGWMTLVIQPNVKVNGTIGCTSVLLDFWVGYGYSSSRRRNRALLLCFSCRQKPFSLSSRFIV